MNKYDDMFRKINIKELLENGPPPLPPEKKAQFRFDKVQYDSILPESAGEYAGYRYPTLEERDDECGAKKPIQKTAILRFCMNSQPDYVEVTMTDIPDGTIAYDVAMTAVTLLNRKFEGENFVRNFYFWGVDTKGEVSDFVFEYSWLCDEYQ